MEYISLDQLLGNKKIYIPIIQRDYIQGADARDINYVRKRLINDLIDTLKGEGKVLDLGIIYGINKGEKFYPVDGQQRLTTLYLFQWFIALKANKIDESKVFKNKIIYMTRKSAREFFSFIIDNIVDKENKYYAEIIDIINVDKNKNFIREIKNKIWFKSQWNNDITINSALNIINDFIELKISESDAEVYYNNLGKIGFHFLTENSENAERESAIRYIRMNSRGMQLTYFENVKARLEIIEDKINGNKNKKEEQFVYQYDCKFIDVFYNKLKEYTVRVEKAKRINEESINLLMNVYNIIVFLKDYDNNKRQYEKYEEFYSHIYNISKSNEDILDKEVEFWTEYFNMLKAILTFSYENEEVLKYINEIFNRVCFFEEERASEITDNNKIIAYLRYLYYIYICPAKKQGDNIEKIKKLEYVLVNLQYDKWKQSRYREIDSFVKKVSVDDDSFCYLGKNHEIISGAFNSSCENAQMLELDIDFKSIGINDIKQRFKEISIKAKIIHDYGWNYHEFRELEEKSMCEKIQYLIYISDMWENDITSEKVEKLKKYICISNRYFMECTKKNYDTTDKEFEWRKIFAISANWDKQNDTLLSGDEINENINKNIVNNYNLWHWEDEYYFWDDKEEIKKIKLNIVRQAYDLIIKNELSLTGNLKRFYNNILGDRKYNMCWLKYAIDRRYRQLLFNLIRSENNKLKIVFTKPYRSYYKDVPIDFFSVVLFLDIRKTRKEDVSVNIFNSLNYISFDSFVFWGYTYKYFTLEKNQKYKHNIKDIFYEEKFNHNMHLSARGEIKILSDNGNVFVYDNNKKVVYRYDFDNNKYTVFQWKTEFIEHKIRNLITEAKKELKDIEDKCNEWKYDRILDINNGSDMKWKRVYDKRYKDWKYVDNFEVEEKNMEWERVVTSELTICGDVSM